MELDRKEIINTAEKIKAMGLDDKALHRKMQNVSEKIQALRKELELISIKARALIEKIQKKLKVLYIVRDAIYWVIASLIN